MTFRLTAATPEGARVSEMEMSVDQLAAPNGSEPFVVWWLREIEIRGHHAEILTVEEAEGMPGYVRELRP